MGDESRDTHERRQTREDLLRVLHAQPGKMRVEERTDDLVVWPLPTAPGADGGVYAFVAPEGNRIATATCLCPLLDEDLARDLLERADRYLMVGVWRHRQTHQMRTLLRLYFLVPDPHAGSDLMEQAVMDNLSWVFAQADTVARLCDDGHMLG